MEIEGISRPGGFAQCHDDESEDFPSTEVMYNGWIWRCSDD